MRGDFRLALINRWTAGLAAGAGAAWYLAARALTPARSDAALNAGLELLSAPRRVLALAPHPGDLEWFCGGTCFLAAMAGGTVAAAILTRGERGGNRANMAEIRGKEQAQSGAILRYERIIHLGLPDGGLRAGTVASRLEELWRELEPEVVLAPDPRGMLPEGNHPDHVAAGTAVRRLVEAGTGRGARVYFYGTRRADVLVDITEVVQEKEAAVRSHRSQLAGPDWLARMAVRGFGRLVRGRTPAFYGETFYRLV